MIIKIKCINNLFTISLESPEGEVIRKQEGLTQEKFNFYFKEFSELTGVNC